MIKKACDQDLTRSLDTLKGLSLTIVAQVVIRDSCGTWHGLCNRNQHLQHPKKHKKEPETQKQVNQWMVEDSRVKTERN